MNAATTESTQAAAAYSVEAVPTCPLCGNGERRLLHAALRDVTLDAFPGSFDLVECTRCKSAYLSTRPTAEALALAYHNYPTHERPSGDARNAAPSLPGRLRRAVTEAYRDRRFRGHGGLGRWLRSAPLALFPSRRREIDNVVRFLPARPGRLLDFGSGGGGFLDIAQSYGWQAEGVDFDPETIAVCRAAGLRVTAASEFDVEAHREQFDAVTLAHVLEHVPAPITLLASLHDMLKSGGHLYVELPNVTSIGHEQYGRAWRGLEVPRHFSLPTPRYLKSELERIGFTDVTFRPRRVVYPSIAQESEKAVEDAPQGGAPKSKFARQARTTSDRTEFITLTARKR